MSTDVPSIRSILDLVEYLVFQADPETNRLRALNPATRNLLDALPKGDAFNHLFGVRHAAELLEVSDEGNELYTRLDLDDGTSVPLKWGLLRRQSSSGVVVECVTARWDPLLDLMDALERESLQFKELALNVLPRHVANELVTKKAVRPRAYRSCAFLYVDSVHFSARTKACDPVSLVRTLNRYFSAFDEVLAAMRVEKVRSSGDAYLAVAGMPTKKSSATVDAALAALGMLAAARERGVEPRVVDGVDLNNWTFRLGIHTGPCIAGVVGNKRHVFDVWGDAVGVAEAIQADAAPGTIRVSEAARADLEPFFEFEEGSSVEVKHVGTVHTATLLGLQAEFRGSDGQPTDEFFSAYCDRYDLHPGREDRARFPLPVSDYLDQLEEV